MEILNFLASNKVDLDRGVVFDLDANIFLSLRFAVSTIPHMSNLPHFTVLEIFIKPSYSYFTVSGMAKRALSNI